MDSPDTRRPPTQPTAPGNHEADGGELDYVLWIYLGAESVFFYPPGSVQEHLVVEHGIPSLVVHIPSLVVPGKAKGRRYDHEGDHRKQQGVRSGTVGDLVAVTHAHEQVA